MARTSSDLNARDRILAAATEVFASIGFAGARIDDIAARAGVNKAMLYYHVGDKEQLYAAVLTGTMERGLASLRAATARAESPADKLQCLLDTLAELGASDPHFVPIMLREIASGGATLPDEMLLRMAAVFRVVADVLAEGTAKGVFRKTDPLLTHVTLAGSMIFLVASQPIRARLSKVAGIEHHATLRDLARHSGDLFLEGLAVERRRSRPQASRKARGKGTKK